MYQPLMCSQKCQKQVILPDVFISGGGELQKGRIAQKQYLTIALPEQKESTAVMHKSAQNKTA